ncbi:MAG TPA: hypothetical protein VF250_13900 [Conexibacter sp.]
MHAGAKHGLTRAARAALAAIGTLAACAAPAVGATTTYPAGGSGFDAGPDGWTVSDTSCGMTGGVSVVCSTGGSYDAIGGNPGGALSTNVDVTVNALGLFAAAATWTSPSFDVPAGAQVTGVAFAFDAALATGGLVALGLAGDVQATLSDVTATSTTALPGVALDGRSAAFATAGGSVPAGALVPGHSYRIVLRTAIASSLTSLGVLGRASARLDNVGLDVTSADPPAGGSGGGGAGGDAGAGGGSGSGAGVGTGTGGAGSGSGAAAAVVPGRGGCTIVGTPRADRLVGTRGRDVICGLGGNDVVLGRGGADTLIGGTGRDVLLGGGGPDVLRGGPGGDALRGGAGRDALLGGPGRDLLVGGLGADILRGGGGGDRLLGGPGRDVARGTLRRDRVTGVERRRR